MISSSYRKMYAQKGPATRHRDVRRDRDGAEQSKAKRKRIPPSPGTPGRVGSAEPFSRDKLQRGWLLRRVEAEW